MNYFVHAALCLLSGWVIGVAPGFGFSQTPASHAKVELRLAEINAGPGLTAAKVDGALQRIYLHKDAIITNKDIIEAHAIESRIAPGLFEVAVVFTKNGAERMAAATESKKALLAILIDGKVVEVTGIAARIYDKAIISGRMTRDEAEHLTAILSRAHGASH